MGSYKGYDSYDIRLGPIGRFLKLLEANQGFGLRTTWLEKGPDAAITQAQEQGLLNEDDANDLRTKNLQELDAIVVAETRRENEDAGVDLPPNPVWVRIWVKPPGPGGT